MLIHPTRAGNYDLEASLDHRFLSAILMHALASGVIPSHFETGFSFSDGNLGLSIKTRLLVQVDQASVIHIRGRDRSVGLSVSYSGFIENSIDLADWTIATPDGGTYTESGLNRTFDVPFSGKLVAIASLSFAAVGSSNLLIISFAGLADLSMHNIGDLAIGAKFNELIRQVFERIWVVTLRTQITFPNLNGLAGSLPAPAKQIFDSDAGQLGLLDLKDVAGGAPSREELHVLLEADQNLGHQSYSADVVFAQGFDFAVGVGSRWLKQILQDLWIGGVIPTVFDNAGKPDPAGEVFLTELDITLFDGSIQFSATLQKTVVVPIAVKAVIELAPQAKGGLISFRVVNTNIDIGLPWAVAGGWASVFFVVWEVMLKMVLRAADAILDPWAQSQLQKFLDDQTIQLTPAIQWSGTPYKIDLAIDGLLASRDRLAAGFTATISH
ncbi:MULTISPECIES: hypothetical protein [unclassified Bradyrhizobium]|uniref:hypothetical protein n=1 Tax=unclassified Bradyrhizobium TaxID=2631580 RepID=UPI002916D2A3|nr:MULTISPECIES: hypothetical protein [unclassified Bradyrhizobium]